MSDWSLRIQLNALDENDALSYASEVANELDRPVEVRLYNRKVTVVEPGVKVTRVDTPMLSKYRVRWTSYSNIGRITYDGEDIGGVYEGKWVAVGRYRNTRSHSVFVSGKTREECKSKIGSHPWDTAVMDVEYIEGVR